MLPVGNLCKFFHYHGEPFARSKTVTGVSQADHPQGTVFSSWPTAQPQTRLEEPVHYVDQPCFHFDFIHQTLRANEAGYPLLQEQAAGVRLRSPPPRHRLHPHHAAFLRLEVVVVVLVVPVVVVVVSVVIVARYHAHCIEAGHQKGEEAKCVEAA